MLYAVFAGSSHSEGVDNTVSRDTRCAAMAAWPGEIPPSLDGTLRLNNTVKSFCFNRFTRRFIKYLLQNTPPLNATVLKCEDSLAALAISSKAAAIVSWNFAEIAVGGRLF